MRTSDRLASRLHSGPLASHGFRWIWIGEAVSAAGTQFHLVALPWLALQVSGSGAALGAVLATAAVPRAALLIVGGALTDRWSARRVMLLSNIARGVLAAVLAAAVAAGMASMPLLYIVSGLFGLSDALFHPAHAALVPRLVSSEQLAAANGLIHGSRQALGLATPALAGIVVAANGPAAAFAIDAATFVFAAAALLRVPDHGALAATPHFSLGSEIRAGLNYARTHRHLRALLAAIAAINVAFVGPFVIGAAALAAECFEGGAAVLGWLLSAVATGALVGVALAPPLDRRVSRGTLTLSGMLVIAAALTAMGLVRDVREAAAAAAAGGLAAGVLNPLIFSWLQRETSPALQGRVLSLAMLGALGLTPVSYVLAGLLVERSAAAPFLAAGVALAAMACLLARPLRTS